MHSLSNNQEGRVINMKSKKNYLFAPFKNDDDKIEEFNAVINALKYVLADVNPSLTDTDKNHYLESALHGLRVFIGRLESYYDVIVDSLSREDEVECLKAKYSAEIKELKADVKRHEKQYHMMASSHNPQEYKQEADEYFSHNPQDEKLFFFMVGGSGVDEDGDVINTLNVGVDCIAECDNYKGVISVETYK